MLARRTLLAAIGGGLVVATTALNAHAGPALVASAGEPPLPDTSRTVAAMRRSLAPQGQAEGPREMQYYVVRRRYWVRRTYVRRRNFAWRCWSNGYSRVCRWRYF